MYSYSFFFFFFSAFTPGPEDTFCEVYKLGSWVPCYCDEPVDNRVPICICENKEVSPFLQIRWKRLVMDQAYTSIELPVLLVRFAKLLSVERMWIITTSPTTNLTPITRGLGENEDMLVDESTSRERKYLKKIKNLIDNFLNVPQFHADTELFDRNITEPIFNRTEPWSWSTQILIQVMGLIMIQHR